MTIDSLGIWRAEKTGIAPGTLYRFSIDGRTASDPYGKAWSWKILMVVVVGLSLSILSTGPMLAENPFHR